MAHTPFSSKSPIPAKSKNGEERRSTIASWFAIDRRTFERRGDFHDENFSLASEALVKPTRIQEVPNCSR